VGLNRTFMELKPVCALMTLEGKKTS